MRNNRAGNLGKGFGIFARLRLNIRCQFQKVVNRIFKGRAEFVGNTCDGVNQIADCFVCVADREVEHLQKDTEYDRSDGDNRGYDSVCKFHCFQSFLISMMS